MIECSKANMAGGGSAEPIGIHNLAILIGSVITLSVTMLVLIKAMDGSDKFSIDGSPVILILMFLIGCALLFWGYWQGNQIKIHTDESAVMEAELID